MLCRYSSATRPSARPSLFTPSIQSSRECYCGLAILTPARSVPSVPRSALALADDASIRPDRRVSNRPLIRVFTRPYNFDVRPESNPSIRSPSARCVWRPICALVSLSRLPTGFSARSPGRRSRLSVSTRCGVTFCASARSVEPTNIPANIAIGTRFIHNPNNHIHH